MEAKYAAFVTICRWVESYDYPPRQDESKGPTLLLIALDRIDVSVVAHMKSDIELTLPSLCRGGYTIVSARVTNSLRSRTSAQPTPRYYPPVFV